MKKIILVGTVLLFAMTFGLPLLHAQQGQQQQQQQAGPAGPDQQGWQCPRWMGQGGGMGRGMRGTTVMEVAGGDRARGSTRDSPSTRTRRSRCWSNT